MENQVGFGYRMPNGSLLYIVSSRPLEDDEGDDSFEIIKGLRYEIHWDKKIFPFHFPTQAEAMLSAVSIQWGAVNA